MKLSVILCTHNPRGGYLRRTLDGLRAQTLPPAAWELLVIDNASDEPLGRACDLSWHAATRVVREEELGLTCARLRGISEARGDVLVWVDDDNVLAPDYLTTALRLAQDWPQLGVFGCGHYTPEWEETPSPSLAPYLHYLAVNRAPRDRWSNQLHDFEATPSGAGLCVRNIVAQHYAANVRQDLRRKALGRRGAGLGACEDHDLAFTAIDLGYGTGVFTALRITHLIPAARVQEEYLTRLVEGHACSTVMLMALRDPASHPPRRRWIDHVRRWRLHRSLTPVERRIDDARARGAARAWELLRNNGSPSS